MAGDKPCDLARTGQTPGVIQVRVVCPADQSGGVLEVLRHHPGATNVARLGHVVLEPAADAITADVAREAAGPLLDKLREAGVEDNGSVVLSTLDTALGRSIERAEQESAGYEDDALIWEELESTTSEESTLSVSFLIFLVIATMIAAVGLLTDSPILIVGAMVVGAGIRPARRFGGRGQAAEVVPCPAVPTSPCSRFPVGDRRDGDRGGAAGRGRQDSRQLSRGSPPAHRLRCPARPLQRDRCAHRRGRRDRLAYGCQVERARRGLHQRDDGAGSRRGGRCWGHRPRCGRRRLTGATARESVLHLCGRAGDSDHPGARAGGERPG